MLTTIEWLWNIVPWWIGPVIAVVLIAIFWSYIAPIWAIIPKPVKWLIGFVASVFVAMQYGRNRGEKVAEQKRANENAHAVETRNKIDAKVDAMPPSDVDANLERNKWMRD